MYGGNTNYHGNPYIQGTTVPCDTYIYTYIYIYRKFSPVVRLGGLAPARPIKWPVTKRNTAHPANLHVLVYTLLHREAPYQVVQTYGSP